MKLLLLIFRNLRRSWLRTTLTALGSIVLVMVVTLAWSILWFIDGVTAEKSRNFKVIVSERWQIPSQMPYTYASTLEEAAARYPDDIRPMDSMTWQFYGGTLDSGEITRENLVFAIAAEPKKIGTMLDELEDLTGEDKRAFDKLIAELESNRKGIIIGKERLKAINKRVGERITVYSINYKDLNLEFDIIGTFPVPRYDQSAVMNRDYLNDSLDNFPNEHQGEVHPLAEKSLNLVWLRVPDRSSFDQVADQVMNSPLYSMPAVKAESQSSGIATFLEAYRDIFWGVRWVLTPAIVVTLALVVANAISISVRERRTEVAILKVLGFRPGHILVLVLGEAFAIGTLSGLASAGGAYYLINEVFGGLKIPIAFFPAFFIPAVALWWGFGLGAGTALAGSLWPAWTACRVKVSEVFAKVD